MFKDKIEKALLKFAVLIVILNLASCGGKGSSSVTNTSPIATFYTITAQAGSNGSVTPSGITSVAQGASQSYTITPNSGFAVATLLVDGVTVAKSTTHTFANVRANHTISATFSAATAGDIALSLIAARTSGVAPLAVFFDASGTTDAGVTARPFHDLEYTWDFGDPTAGTWAYGAQPGVSSKNSTTGPVAAHVFEKPGTYTVTLTVFDGTNTVNKTQLISVEDPESVFAGAKTSCVSTSGTFTGCPTGASHVTSSDLVTAMRSISGTVKRILFRAGETWATSTGVNVTQPGPGLIGSYGAGAKPYVQVSGSSHSTITFQNVGVDDWRVMDMAFDALGTTSTNIIQLYDRAQITLLRLDVTNSNGAYDTGNSTIPNTDQFTVQDSTANGLTCEDGQGCVQVWVYGTRFAFQGNHMDNTRPGTGGVIGGEHVLRFPKVTKGVIANNDAWNPNAGKHCLKLHSDNRPTQAIFDGTFTELVVVADNYFKGSTGSPWPVAIMAQNGAVDERLRNIIVERNYVTSVNSNSMMVIGSTVSGTVRNNIFNLGDATTYGVGVNDYSAGQSFPPTDDIHIYNNTFYGTHVANADHVHGISISATVLSTIARNNLVVAPNDSSATATWATGVTLVTDHNLVSTSPIAVWVSGTPALPSDFALKSGSTAIGAGTAVPVWDDFVRATRATTWDIGAYAH